MKLHESPSPNARRVHVFLAEKGIEAPPTVRVDIRGGENLTDDYRKLNPFGRVPVLELDDGTCLAESVAIFFINSKSLKASCPERWKFLRKMVNSWKPPKKKAVKSNMAKMKGKKKGPKD